MPKFIAMEIGALRDVYNRVAGRYDFQHALLTARSDQRGRRMLVNTAVRAGDSVLDCGAGTESTALLALEKVGLSGKVVLFDISDGAKELYRVTKPGGRIGVAHSTDPENRIVRWLANKVERVVWHFPTLSLFAHPNSTLLPMSAPETAVSPRTPTSFAIQLVYQMI